jgi:uroporphyrinogen decarboxylase
MSVLQNDLLLRTLRGEKTERTPVWMMRQAGRYLPEYQELKSKYSFFERCKTPELATAITLQPVEQLGVDAAIIFSDILVVPMAMGMEVQMQEGIGPLLPAPIRTIQDLNRLHIPDVAAELGYVFEALKLTKKTLGGKVPLIGFAGAPWTLLCYMVQGKGSKTFDEAKAFCYTQPALADKLLQKITDTSIAYLKGQAEAGADVVQIFDSWGGLLGPDDFENLSLKYIRQIVAALSGEVLTITFAQGAWQSLGELSATGTHGLGIDWGMRPETARKLAGNKVTLQGNLDPAKLLSPIPVIRKEVRAMLKSFGKNRYIANLGHGILPNTSVDQARAFVETVKEYEFAETGAFENP